MKELIYDEDFYNSQSEASSRSAFAVAPILIDFVRPQSVVDIGCGLGTWLRALRESGVKDILGIDGEYIDRHRLQIPPDCFLSMDFTTSKPRINRSFDLALCLEVAEHIPEEAAPNLINFIASLAPAVCFSAAVPGQGGAGHPNEQWPDYWNRLFAERGYQCLDVLRPRIWNITVVESWYCQNIFMFIQETQRSRYPGLLAASSLPAPLPTRLVHPELFRRFASLEYVQSGSLACELLARLKRKFLRRASHTR